MEEHYTPGVHIEHVLTEPKREFRTGAPVFLGLIRQEDLALHNSLQDVDDEKFIVRPIPGFPGMFVARKKGYLQLPERPRDPRSDSLMAVPQSYLQAARPYRAPSERNLESIHASAGAAGQPDSGAEEAVGKTLSFSLKPQRFTVWPQFEATYGSISHAGFLTYAVRGFFENRGALCYVQLIQYSGDKRRAIIAGLETLAISSDYDLVCVPDIMWGVDLADAGEVSFVGEMQRAVIQHCQRLGDRFAILDSAPAANTDDVIRQRRELGGEAAALYYPWLRVDQGPTTTGGYIPPSGHVAGVYARTDATIGVYKAPANETMEGARDLAVAITDDQQAELNPQGVNCIRAFPRRGIRIWGARTLSSSVAWRYINVRRIFITAARWIERNMMDVVFEPNTPDLWPRIERDLTYYFSDLLQQGALAGSSAQEAFYVKCDAETNPPELRDLGMVVTEIGLAPAAPAEFIVVRIMHGLTGARIIGPS